jgi:hypothetical protein
MIVFKQKTVNNLLISEQRDEVNKQKKRKGEKSHNEKLKMFNSLPRS